MMQHRYWVLGGDYTCLGFRALRDGACQVAGPFETRTEANEVWKRLSGDHSSRATTRFSIAAEELFVPQ